MGSHGIQGTVVPFSPRHGACLSVLSSSRIMTHRAHFWLRLVGLTLILAAEFGPRLWAGSAPPAPTPIATAADAR
jgi:hypothetical protein